MVKKYIIFTYPINEVGGTQLCTAGRASYLEKHGWQVYVFTRGSSHGESEVPSLTKYISGCGFDELRNRPYKMSDRDRNALLDRMVDILRIDTTIENEIIVESHYDVVSYWAELLAERIHARHFALILNVDFRRPYQFYFENLDFFYFKHLRNEFACPIDGMFNGYRNLTDEHDAKFPEFINWGCEQEPIQDVDNPNISILAQDHSCDFTILHIGRQQKLVVQSMFRGIADFARKYPNKKIRFIVVGIFDQKEKFAPFNGLSNVKIILLGILVPIPRSLFDIVDVVIAEAQTAMFCAETNVPVIVPVSDTGKTAGVLYYDVEDPWPGEKDAYITYVEILKKVLIDREYDNRQPTLLPDPPLRPSEWHYEKTLEWQRKNTTPLEYFTSDFNIDFRKPWVNIFPFKYVDRGAKVVLYGMGEVSKDYQYQMKGYCELVAVVADDHEHYDKTVLAPEKLKELTFDCIVIAIEPNKYVIDAITNKILRLVGQTNTIYDWNPYRRGLERGIV